MTTRTFVRQLSLLTILAVLANTSLAADQETGKPPVNAPAKVQWNAEKGKLRLEYHGTTILDATIVGEDTDGNTVEGVTVKLERTETPGDDKVEQRLKFVLAKPKKGVGLVLRGTIWTTPARRKAGPSLSACQATAMSRRNRTVEGRQRP